MAAAAVNLKKRTATSNLSAVVTWFLRITCPLTPPGKPLMRRWQDSRLSLFSKLLSFPLTETTVSLLRRTVTFTTSTKAISSLRMISPNTPSGKLPKLSWTASRVKKGSAMKKLPNKVLALDGSACDCFQSILDGPLLVFYLHSDARAVEYSKNYIDFYSQKRLFRFVSQ